MARLAQRIVACLWFDKEAEQAASFYAGIFERSGSPASPATARQGGTDPDRAKADRVMQALLQLRKIDVAALERAAGGARS